MNIRRPFLLTFHFIPSQYKDSSTHITNLILPPFLLICTPAVLTWFDLNFSESLGAPPFFRFDAFKHFSANDVHN